LSNSTHFRWDYSLENLDDSAKEKIKHIQILKPCEGCVWLAKHSIFLREAKYTTTKKLGNAHKQIRLWVKRQSCVEGIVAITEAALPRLTPMAIRCIKNTVALLSLRYPGPYLSHQNEHINPSSSPQASRVSTHKWEK